MVSLKDKSEDIIKVLFWLDLISLIVAIFYISKGFAITIFAINIILCGSFWILKKYSIIFDALMVTNKFAKGLNKSLEKLG